MKKIKALVVGSVLAAALAACAYTGVAVTGDKVIIARTGMIYGLMRAMYVCKLADNGVTNCQTNESP
jgi:hypothetical protein